jgi:hypothetical protein
VSLSATNDIIFYVVLVDFGGIVGWLGIALYIAYFKVDLMLNHLKNCPVVMIRAPFKNGGPGGRLFLLGAIIGLMTMPRFHIRHGGASAEDLKNFPKDLKLKLIILQRMGWLLMLVMCGTATAIKLGRD